eukprot:CAMPEP_0179129548 /NCGR_PEP_ID=MMETSP0796-20121207/61471_1 /TAXON_ID=73915 /ORGANISM="Pyrodinium bahamense, Strain pbaha01" /LENGTH=39 /DNA_ID= /DNA_START= /DNA_END= /DNA_ORIENTATION=
MVLYVAVDVVDGHGWHKLAQSDEETRRAEAEVGELQEHL